MTGRAATGVSIFERIEALVANDALYVLGDLIPTPPLERGGRPRTYPMYAVILYGCMVTVFGSARRVETELSHSVLWNHLRGLVAQRFPDDPTRWLPEAPMRAHIYSYYRDRYLTDPCTWSEVQGAFEQMATAQAVEELGLCDPDGPGSLTHPDLSRMLYGDGKVVTPLFRATPGTKRRDTATGEVRPARSDPDGGLHMEGSGVAAWGTKFVMVAVRSPEPHERVITAFDWVPKPGGEVKVARACIDRVAPLLPGTQGVVYDGAFRGVDHQHLMHDLGLLSVSPQRAQSGGRRARRPRVEHRVWIEENRVRGGDGCRPTVQLYADGGAVCVGELNQAGEIVVVRLIRKKLFKRANADGGWRWYGDYELPSALGGGRLTTRLDTTDEDRKRGFKRTEHLRPIAHGDPDYDRLYSRRPDAESINRQLDDSLWLRRAHSVGHARQLVDLLGYALVVNSVALHRHRASLAPPGRLAA